VLLAGFAVFAAVFLAVERRAMEPILPLRLFRRATFAIANAATFILGFSMFGAIIYVPLYLQIVKGATPTKSGLLMLPMMAGIIVTSIASGRVISQVARYKWFTVAGTAIMAGGLGLFTRLQVDTPLWQAFIFMLVIGIGLGMAMQPLILALQNSLDLRDMGAGTSAATFFRSLGGSVGVAALGAVLSNQLAGLRGTSINDPASLKKLPPAALDAIQHLFVRALHPIFLVAALVSLVAVVLCLMLPDSVLHGRGPGAAPVDAGELAEASVG
jgi:predicted MFS family arabinose efflux permease